MPAIQATKDDWTPAKLNEHRAWRAKMFAPDKPEPKPDPLAAKIEVMADPERAALECKVRELETLLDTVRTELVTAKQRKALFPEELEGNPSPRIEEIIRIVARYYGVGVTDIKSARRTKVIALIRHVAMYLCKQLTLRSLPEIGIHFGRRDHTTILHGFRKIEAQRLTDAGLCQEVAELESLFE